MSLLNIANDIAKTSDTCDNPALEEALEKAVHLQEEKSAKHNADILSKMNIPDSFRDYLARSTYGRRIVDLSVIRYNDLADLLWANGELRDADNNIVGYLSVAHVYLADKLNASKLYESKKLCEEPMIRHIDFDPFGRGGRYVYDKKEDLEKHLEYGIDRGVLTAPYTAAKVQLEYVRLNDETTISFSIYLCGLCALLDNDGVGTSIWDLLEEVGYTSELTDDEFNYVEEFCYKNSGSMLFAYVNGLDDNFVFSVRKCPVSEETKDEHTGQSLYSYIHWYQVNPEYEEDNWVERCTCRVMADAVHVISADKASETTKDGYADNDEIFEEVLNRLRAIGYVQSWIDMCTEHKDEVLNYGIYFANLDEQDKIWIQTFKEKYGYIPYRVVKIEDLSSTNLWYEILFINPDKKLWAEDRDDIADGRAMAYVINVEYPEDSEFGYVSTRE